MLIEVIDRQAPQRLLDRLEQSGRTAAGWGALHFACVDSGPAPDQDRLLPVIRTLLEGKKALLYLFEDGDFAVAWNGAQKSVVEAMQEAVGNCLDAAPGSLTAQYYDAIAQGEELRVLCRRKMRQGAASGVVEWVEHAGGAPAFDASQIASFQTLAAQRAKRKQLAILIVEDQLFSAKLLNSLLRRISQTSIAHNAGEALSFYITHAPDIVFLDIELPDMNGHDLAEKLTALDPDAYIVMVTANHYLEDVSRAKHNHAKGFVVKPYSKRKILENVEKYIQERKLTKEAP